MTPHSRRPIVIALLVFASLAGGCTVRRATLPPDRARELNQKAPFLKVHMQSGGLYVLSAWSVDEEGRVVSGRGVRYDADRKVTGDGAFTVGVDSVALFETNAREVPGAIVAMTVVTAISVAITIMCAVEPKTCFGSCPTFYVNQGGDVVLRAEGFSSSIAPWLEKTDVDALAMNARGGSGVDIVMRDEAMETHVVRHVDLLAVPNSGTLPPVKDGAGRFWSVGATAPPTTCRGPEGDVLPFVRERDGGERYSLADSVDLAARETIDVDFAPMGAERLGLVVTARQTLLSTFLLYETLACAGSEAGRWLARPSPFVSESPLLGALGGIEVSVRDGTGAWRKVGEVGEVGPLASDAFVMPLPSDLRTGQGVECRLQMAKGAWRIDQIALVRLEGEVEAVRVPPAYVLRDGHPDDDALVALLDPDAVLTAMPGDACTIHYELPGDGVRYELFLESRGYYLEWMRDEWLAEEDHEKLAEMMLSTHTALRRLAPAYKRLEPSMEDAFWRSRYAKP